VIPDGSQIPQVVRSLRTVVLFSPEPDQQQQGRWYGVAATAGTTADRMRQELAQQGGAVTVSGLEAYSVEPGGLMAMARQQQPQAGMLVAPVEDNLILAANDEASLGRLMEVYQGGTGADLSEVRQMASAYAGDTIISVATVSPEMMTPPPGQPMPPAAAEFLESLAGAKAMASGLRLDRGISLRALVRMGDSAQASALVDKVNSQLAGLKQQLAQSGQAQNPMVMMVQPALNNVTVSADGSDVKLGMQLSEQDLQNIVNFVKQMVQMMQQQMQGGMMGPPGGGGTSSMGGGR